MKKISLFIAAFAIVFVLVAGCATVEKVVEPAELIGPTVTVETLPIPKIAHIQFAIGDREIKGMYFIPVVFPKFPMKWENPTEIVPIYSQFVMAIWRNIEGNDYGLAFDKYDSTLVLAAAMGSDFVEYEESGRIWIYPKDKDGFPIEVTWDEQHMWILEQDRELGLRERQYSQTQMIILASEQAEVLEVKPFHFFSQTFQVPKSWPSEQEMVKLPVEKMSDGNVINYAYMMQKEARATTVYWFIGIETKVGFVTKALTQTWMITGYGLLDCQHWAVNSDGTITELSCDQFGILLNKLSGSSV